MDNGTVYQSRSPTPPYPSSAKPPRVTQKRRSLFDLGLAIGLTLVVFWGFAPSYYLRTEFGRPPLHSSLVHFHGFLFTAWMLLLLAQSALISIRQVKWHRRLGTAGALLAAMMTVIGIATVLGSTRRMQARIAEYVHGK